MTAFLVEQASGDIEVFAGHRWKRHSVSGLPLGLRWIGSIHSEFGHYLVEAADNREAVEREDFRIVGTSLTFEAGLRMLLDEFDEGGIAEL